jgi:peptide/nickel transport system substrate-binding protein
MAIDRDAISSQLFDGKQAVAHSQTNPLDRVYFGGIPKYAFDPKAAAALLDEAGWKMSADGVRQNEKGEKLRLEIMTTAGNKTRELVEQAMQSQWKQSGIDMRIRNEPARVFFGETVSKRKYTALAMFAWISSPENIPRSTLRSDEIPTADNGWSGQNYTGFSNEEMDKVLDDMEVVCEPQANQALWNRMQSLYAEELPAIPLYFRANAFLMPKWLTGVTPTGHQYPTSLWIETWGAEE